MTEAAWSDDYLTRAALAVDWRGAFDRAMKEHPDDFRNHFSAELTALIEKAAGVRETKDGIFAEIFRAGLSAAVEDGDMDSTLAELISGEFDGIEEGSDAWIEAKKRHDFAENTLDVDVFLTSPFEDEGEEDEDDL